MELGYVPESTPSGASFLGATSPSCVGGGTEDRSDHDDDQHATD